MVLNGRLDFLALHVMALHAFDLHSLASPLVEKILHSHMSSFCDIFSISTIFSRVGSFVFITASLSK